MKAIFLAITFFVSSAYQLRAQPTDYASQLQQQLDQDITDGQFVGGTVGILVGEQEIIVAGGQRDRETQAPYTTTTLNRIASIAKSMTAVAALQLFERGALDLDAPISTYLPDYPKEQADQITTRQLLLHSSGIGAYKSNKETESTKEYTSLAEAATVFQDRPLVDVPGNAEHYTTYGYVVLGMVIESVSEMSYEEYMQEHIWTVAGMEHTGVEHSREDYANKASLYHRTKKGKIKASDTNNLSNRVPGGGLYSTAGDLLKFGKAVLNHQLINEQTFTMMMKAPGLPYEGNPYGMGWFLYGENPKLGQVYGHNGGQTGCTSLLLIIPDHHAAIVVMNNTALTLDHVFGTAIKLFPTIEQMSKGSK